MFIEELENNSLCINTKGGLYYNTTFDANLDIFSMATRFLDENKLYKQFNKAFSENKYLLTANILYLLDIRNGKGERRVFKFFFKEMCYKDQKLAEIILNQIPNLGRYDYLFESYNTPLWDKALNIISNQLKKDISSDTPSLLAKWMPSLRNHNVNNNFAKRLSKMLKMSEAEYRKTLSNLRSKIDIVEKKISNRNYQIDYEKVPSKAMKNYQNVFFKYDYENFTNYLASLKKGEAKINTKGLAPYELVKLALENKGNPEVINQLWEKQENYFTNSTNSNVLVIADTSGSMSSYNNIPISSAVGLAIYLAERNTGIFHNKFINFSSYPTLQTISGSNLTEILENLDYDNWDSATNINRAMSLILKATKKSRDDAPSHLLIISDMEFDSCVEEKTNYSYWKEEYQKYGIKMPKIIFWNVAGNSLGIPVTKNEDGVAIVSGFSPSIFKGIFDIENYNPIEVMKEILKPYMDLITIE